MAKESEIRIFNSQSSGATPDVSQMAYGELAINTADDKLFYKRSTSGLGTISARDPYMGFRYEYKTGGVTSGTTGGINISGNTFSVHPEDLDGNDLTSFWESVRVAETGLIYWAAEDRDKTINNMSFVTGDYKSAPDDTVLTFNGSHLVSNALTDGQDVIVLVTTTGKTADLPTVPSELRYRFAPYSLSSGDTKFALSGYTILEKTGHWCPTVGGGIWPDMDQAPFYLPPQRAFFNKIDIDGVDATLFFKQVGPGDIISVENAETFVNGGVTYRPGQIYMRFVVGQNTSTTEPWDENQYVGYYDDVVQNPGDSGDAFIINTDGEWSDITYSPSFNLGQSVAAGNFTTALEQHNWTPGDTDNDDDGLLFAVTRIPSGGGGPLVAGQREFDREGNIVLSYGFTSGTPTNNGEVYVDTSIIPNNQVQIHKTGELGEDNRQIFSDLTNSRSLINIVRTKGFTAGAGSAYATYTVGPAVYQSGTYWSFDIEDAITGGTSGNTWGYPSLTAGDRVRITISPLKTYNNVETFNGVTGDVEGVSSFNGLTGTVDTSSLTLHVAGISNDGGITFSDGTHQDTAATSITDYVETFNGLTGTVDTSLLTLHVAGISSDGGITVGNLFIGTNEKIMSVTDTDDFVNFGVNKFEIYQDNSRMIKADATRVYVGSSGTNKDLYVFGKLKSYDELNALVGISLDAGGITFPDGTHQDTAATSITDYVESFNGATGAVEGVSSVNGATGDITAGGAGIRFTFEPSVPSMGAGEICITSAVMTVSYTSASGLGMTGAIQDFYDAGGGSVLVSSADGNRVLYIGDIPSSQLTDVSGSSYWRFTFSGTDLINDEANMVSGENLFLSLVPRKTVTSSYAGHIYSPSEGTYYLDPRAPVGRTITEFYAICGTGGISADLYNSGATVGSLNVTPTGATASLSNTSLAEGGTLEMVTSNYSACYDFRFAVRYTQ